MAYDPRIILAGQAPDVVGSLARGTQAAGLSNDVMRQNRLAEVYRQDGPGIMAGEAPALNRLAQIDPMAGLGVQQTRLGMDATRQGMQHSEERLRLAYQQAGMQAQQFAAQLDERQRAQARQTFEQGANMLAAAQTPEQFAQIAQMPGVAEMVEQFVGPGMLSFENRGVIASAAMGAAEAMKVTGGQQAGFRRATPEEAQQYGAAAGQFGPDGRFYPVNPPSGTELTVNPDGTVSMRQGPGAGSREERAAVAAEEQKRSRAELMVEDIGRARDLIGWDTTGAMAQVFSGLGGTRASDLSALLDTLAANIGFAELNAMREASPTGGALGNVTERELAFLQAVQGSIRQSQTAEQLLFNLNRLERALIEVVHGPQAALDASRAGRPAAAPSGRVRYNPETGDLEPAQ